MNATTIYLHRIKIYKIVSITLTVLVILLAIEFRPLSLPYVEFGEGEILQLLWQLFLAALFVERAIEVFMSAWREKEKEIHRNELKSAKEAAENASEPERMQITETVRIKEKEYGNYNAETRVLALMSALGIGIIISALGLRMFEQLVDPVAYEALGNTQRSLFIGIDTLVTGALLGGGSEGIHKMLSPILGFFDTIYERQKKSKS